MCEREASLQSERVAGQRIAHGLSDGWRCAGVSDSRAGASLQKGTTAVHLECKLNVHLQRWASCSAVCRKELGVDPGWSRFWPLCMHDGSELRQLRPTGIVLHSHRNLEGRQRDAASVTSARVTCVADGKPAPLGREGAREVRSGERTCRACDAGLRLTRGRSGLLNAAASSDYRGQRCVNHDGSDRLGPGGRRSESRFV